MTVSCKNLLDFWHPRPQNSPELTCIKTFPHFGFLPKSIFIHCFISKPSNFNHFLNIFCCNYLFMPSWQNTIDRWLIQWKFIFSPFWRLGSPRSGCQQGQFLVKTLLGLQTAAFSLYMHMAGRESKLPVSLLKKALVLEWGPCLHDTISP